MIFLAPPFPQADEAASLDQFRLRHNSAPELFYGDRTPLPRDAHTAIGVEIMSPSPHPVGVRIFPRRGVSRELGWVCVLDAHARL